MMERKNKKIATVGEAIFLPLLEFHFEKKSLHAVVECFFTNNTCVSDTPSLPIKIGRLGVYF